MRLQDADYDDTKAALDGYIRRYTWKPLDVYIRGTHRIIAAVCRQ